jgi:carbazole 1,9a-dioxygenase
MTEAVSKSLESGAYEDAAFGFRNHWYPAMLSDEIAEDQLVPLTLLGENILFKRIDGKVFAIRDECLHRGFRFSAKPECYTKNTITCWLHAFTYNFRTGDLVAIPSAPTSPLIGQRRLHAYPCEERNGMVFTFVGDLMPPPPLVDDVPPGFLADDWCVVGAVNVPCACNWRIAADSGFDPNHVFIHKEDGLLDILERSFPLGQRLVGSNPFHSIEERSGPGPKGIVDALGKAEPIFDFTFECDGEVGHMKSKYPPNDMARRAFGAIEGSVWLPCALKVEPWPVLGMAHFEWYVPVDEGNHRYFIAWATPAKSEAERAKFTEEVHTHWKHVGYENFNKTDLAANLACQESTEGVRYGRNQVLCESDGYTIAWRRFASKHNRGIQRPPTKRDPEISAAKT